MKKLIFKASFLALATLTIFSACKKDEVIEPEFEEKARYYEMKTCFVIIDGVLWSGQECSSGYGNCSYMPCTLSKE